MLITPRDRQIIVNYHYVEDPRPDFSGIFPCPVKEFERQVALLSKNFKITTLRGVFEACRASAPEKVVAITFDDGLCDQYENAFPILKKYGVTASFFIITSTFDGIVPSAHKIHLLLSKISPDELVSMFNSFIAREYPGTAEQYFIPTDRRISKRRQHEGIAVANFKETLSAIPVDIKNKYIAYVFSSQGIDEAKLCKELFMDQSRIASLQAQGFEIGNHTDAHDALSAMSTEQIQYDLRQSQEKLKTVIGEFPASFSYPFGLTSSASRAVLAEEKFECAVTIEARSLVSSDDRLLLPRFDTNDLRNGAVI